MTTLAERKAWMRAGCPVPRAIEDILESPAPVPLPDPTPIHVPEMVAVPEPASAPAPVHMYRHSTFCVVVVTGGDNPGERRVVVHCKECGDKYVQEVTGVMSKLFSDLVQDIGGWIHVLHAVPAADMAEIASALSAGAKPTPMDPISARKALGDILANGGGGPHTVGAGAGSTMASP